MVWIRSVNVGKNYDYIPKSKATATNTDGPLHQFIDFLLLRNFSLKDGILNNTTTNSSRIQQ